MTPQSDLFRRQLGRELRKARLKQGLTMGQMSYKSGVSRHYICALEQGDKEARSGTLAKLFAALDVYPVVSLHTRKVTKDGHSDSDSGRISSGNGHPSGTDRARGMDLQDQREAPNGARSVA